MDLWQTQRAEIDRLAAENKRLRECARQTRAALISLREIVRHRTDLASMDKVTVDLAGSVLERHAWLDLSNDEREVGR